MTSTDDLSANLESARSGIRAAADSGAEFIALPENFAFLRREGKPIPCVQPIDGEIIHSIRELAARHRVPILAGTEVLGNLYLTDKMMPNRGEGLNSIEALSANGMAKSSTEFTSADQQLVEMLSVAILMD